MNQTFDKEVVVNNIIAIPQDRHQQDKSINTLVTESGYLDTHELITEQVIGEGLARTPQRIEEWLRYSEDQRLSDGNILKVECGKYFVVAFSTKDGYNETVDEHPDLKSACAAFIKRELEFSRELIEARNKKKKRK